MKKIILIFAAFVAISVASCCNGNQKANCGADTTVVDSVADSLSTDSVLCDSVC